MLVDTGAAVNIMPYSVLRKLGHSVGDLIKTNIMLSDFNGQTSEAQGVLSVDLTVGGKNRPYVIFCGQQQGLIHRSAWKRLDPCQLLYPFHIAPMSDSMGRR
jgi:hypothetical protein